MGSNPVEAPKTMFGLNCDCLNCKRNCDDDTFICMSAVHIIFICLVPFTGTMNSTNWPAPNVWVIIAQSVDHSSTKAEVMDLNPVEAPKTFFLGLIAIT